MVKSDARSGVRRWREEQGVTTGRIRATGILPFDPIYSAQEGVLSTRERQFYAPKRRFYTERLIGILRGEEAWVTAGPDWQGSTLQGCRNLIAGRTGFRVVVLVSLGRWEVDVPPTTTARPKNFFSERARREWEEANK